jgi:hypothetical protein
MLDDPLATCAPPKMVTPAMDASSVGVSSALEYEASKDVRVVEPAADAATATTEPIGKRAPTVAVPPYARALEPNCVAEVAIAALKRGSGASSTAGAIVTALEWIPRWSVADPPPTAISPRTTWERAVPEGMESPATVLHIMNA